MPAKEKKRIHYIRGTVREKAKKQLYKYNRPQEKFQNVFAQEQKFNRALHLQEEKKKHDLINNRSHLTVDLNN